MEGQADQSALIAFVSLGMVVLDELRLPNGEILYDTVGGSAAYSTLGARLLTSPVDAREVGCFILAGHDFPDDIASLLRSWGIAMDIDADEERLSTRGLLEYHDEAFGRKSFRYLTTPLQPAPGHLPDDFLSSRSFHMLVAAEKVAAQVKDLFDLRKQRGSEQPPVVVWEPLPGECTAEHLESHTQACALVDVFSPNHLELLGLCGERTEGFDSQLIESCAARLLAPAASSSMKAVVVRAGEHGCLVSDRHAKVIWLPPFFKDSRRVVDATGGGNTFLGAFTIAYGRSGDLVDAAIQATVAASFAIEQIGLARRTQAEGVERWNDALVSERLGEYRGRLSIHG